MSFLSSSDSRLHSLNKTGRHVSPGYPDIRKWTVNNRDGKKVGIVDDLLFDEVEKKVKYIVLNLAGNELELEDRQVILTIDITDIYEEEKLVVIRTLSKDQIETLPEYTGDGL